MKAQQPFTIQQLIGDTVAEAIAKIGQMLDQLFASVNSVTPGAIQNGTRAGQLDGVWVVATFTGTVNQTFTHALGRVPLYFLEAFPVLAAGATAGVYGEVQMISATGSTVTLRCQTSGKTARLILF